MKLINALTIAIDGLTEALSQLESLKGSLPAEETHGLARIERARQRLLEFVADMQSEN